MFGADLSLSSCSTNSSPIRETSSITRLYVLIERRYDDETIEEDDEKDKDEMTAQLDGHQ